MCCGIIHYVQAKKNGYNTLQQLGKQKGYRGHLQAYRGKKTRKKAEIKSKKEVKSKRGGRKGEGKKERETN